MNSKIYLRWFAAALTVLTLSGCDSIPTPFGSPQATNTDPSVPPPPGRSGASATSGQAAADSIQAKLSQSQPGSQQEGLSQELNWFPSLDKPLDQLKNDYAGVEDPAKRNFTLSNIAYLYDAKLFVLFQDMLDFLDTQAQAHELKEQNAWLNKRKLLATQAFLKYEDAQQARLAAAQAFIDATKARIAVIDKRRQMVVVH